MLLYYSLQDIRVLFDLHVMHDASVVELEPQQPFQNEDTVILEAVNGNLKHWRSSEIFIPATRVDQFRYRYRVKFKEGIGKKVVNFFTWSKQESIVETKWRQLTEGVHQYDIFKHPQDFDRTHSIFTGQLFHVGKIYYSLGSSYELKEHLIECEHVHFGHVSFYSRDIEKFKSWLHQTATENLTYPQGVFLCSLLAQFVLRVKHGINLQHWLSKKTADNLLKCLVFCPREDLPESTLKFIKEIAVALFSVGTATGWLAYIGFFCHLFDVEFVVQETKRLSAPYTENQFNEYAARALTTLEMIEKEEDLQRLVSHIILRAPVVDCLWVLHTLLDSSSVRLTEILSWAFVQRFEEILSRRRCPNLLTSCTGVWQVTPEALRKQLAVPFCAVLVKQVKEEHSFTQEMLKTLETFAMDEHLQSSQHMLQIIKFLSTSKKVELLEKMIFLLNSPKFDSFWKGIPEEERKKVCTDWMQSFCRWQSSQSLLRRPKGIVLQSLEALERISQARAVQNDEELMSALKERVMSNLHSTSPKLLMDAYQDTERLPQVVQSVYRQLLKEAIKKEAGPGDVHARMSRMIKTLMPSPSSQGLTPKRIHIDG